MGYRLQNLKIAFLIQISKLDCNQAIAFSRFSLKNIGGILGKSLMGGVPFLYRVISQWLVLDGSNSKHAVGI